jgi:hypothetical protein
MAWATNRTPLDELKTLPRTRGVGTLLFGLFCLVVWTVVTLYSNLKVNSRLLEGVLWTGEVLFFWGAAQYLYWGARRVYRQTRTGDRRVPQAGRRATDGGHAPSPEINAPS